MTSRAPHIEYATVIQTTVVRSDYSGTPTCGAKDEAGQVHLWPQNTVKIDNMFTSFQIKFIHLKTSLHNWQTYTHSSILEGKRY